MRFPLLVIAIFCAGASAANAQIVPCANPDPPTGLTATVVAGRVRLSWTPPVAANNCPIAAYTVGIGYATGIANASELDTTQTLMELSFTRGTFYARVQSVLASGQRSAYSTEVQIVIPHPEPVCPTAPLAVSDVSALSVGGGTTITWVAPTTGCPALGYIVAIGPSPGSQDDASITTTAPSAFVEVSIGTSYAVVTPFNSAGLGPDSAPITLNVTSREPNPPPPPSPPCSPERIPPPRNLRAVVIGFIVDLIWDAPERDCPTTGYRLALAPSSNATPSVVIELPPTLRTHTVTLPPFTTGSARLQALAAAGVSAPTIAVAIATESFADCVGPLTYTQAGSVVRFSWQPLFSSCDLSTFILQAGRSRGATEVSVPLSSAARSLTVDAAGASGTWYVRVVGVVSGFGGTVTSNETRVVIP